MSKLTSSLTAALSILNEGHNNKRDNSPEGPSVVDSPNFNSPSSLDDDDNSYKISHTTTSRESLTNIIHPASTTTTTTSITNRINENNNNCNYHHVHNTNHYNIQSTLPNPPDVFTSSLLQRENANNNNNKNPFHHIKGTMDTSTRSINTTIPSYGTGKEQSFHHHHYNQHSQEQQQGISDIHSSSISNSDNNNDSSANSSNSSSRRNSSPPPPQSSQFGSLSRPRNRLARSNSIQVSIHRKPSVNSSTSSPVTAASYASCISSPAISFLSNIAQSTIPNHHCAGVYNEGDRVHHYILEKEIGSGSFSRVHRASNSSPDFPPVVAIKVLKKSHSLTDQQFQEVQQSLFHETQLWASLDHTNVIHMYQVMESDDAIFVVSELAECSLFKYLQKKGPLKEQEAKRVMRQLSAGIKYLHDNGIVHRDIKCENVLLAYPNSSWEIQQKSDDEAHFSTDNDHNNSQQHSFSSQSSPSRQEQDIFDLGGNSDLMNTLPKVKEMYETGGHGESGNISIDRLDAKIADFGLSEDVVKLTGTPVFCVGTLHYCAPEEIKQQLTDWYTSDVWSTGCVLYVMLTGKLPFNDDFLPRLQYAIINGKYDTEIFKQLGISKAAQDLIQHMLQVKIADRYNMEQVLNHPWLKS